jgi:hypothetical protein
MNWKCIALAALMAIAAFAQVDVPFQVGYSAHATSPTATLTITNSGASGADLQSGTDATITGALCANVFAFSPDEQLVSCCSCPVTPNGLIQMSIRNDILANTLTPQIPDSIVIKLIATLPKSGTCKNSAAAVISGTQANGLLAWESTVHALSLTGVAAVPVVTENKLAPATLSSGELNRLGQLCNFILANGSGFGQCRTCRVATPAPPAD